MNAAPQYPFAGRGLGICPRHGAPFVELHAGREPWLVCRHCLENVCETCEEPESLCICQEECK